LSSSQKADSPGHLPLSFCWKPSKLPHFRSSWFFHGCLPLLEPCPGTCLDLPRERATAAPNRIAIWSGYVARTGGATDQRLFACSRTDHSDRHSVGLHPAATICRRRHRRRLWPTRRRLFVAAGGSPTERRTESLLGNSRTEGHLLGPSVREQTPNRTPFCSAPLLVCLVCRFLHCQELDRVTALFMMVSEFLNA